MLRRRQVEEPVPEWELRIRAARSLIEAQRPPEWIIARVEAFHRAVAAAIADRERMHDSLGRLDLDRAARELKDAIRQPRPGPE
ncbi:MAG: hypothetical protein ACLGHQ_09315, partial [Acidimicrobiia bacterium]